MSLFKQFKTDTNLEQKGIFLEYGTAEENGEPIRFKIARAGGSNKNFEKTMERLTKGIRRQIANDIAEDEQVLKVMRRVYAESVILGWENVFDQDGKPLTFNVENCIQLFEDLPDLFQDIQAQARTMALFRKANLETAAGN